MSLQYTEDARMARYPSATELQGWTLQQFAQRIYNDDYVRVDPDYARPRAHALVLKRMFGECGPGVRHLDFGGGDGLLSRLLRESGWASMSYDLFAAREGFNFSSFADGFHAYWRTVPPWARHIIREGGL